jgi:rhodanese-related sulfurtransferase
MSIKTIQPADFLSLLAHSKPCCVDVRTPAEVRNDALDNIIAVPLDQLDSKALSETIDEQHAGTKEVYLICQSGKRAQIAADKLASNLTQDVIIVEGGMNAIRQSAGQQSTPVKMMSIERQVRLTAGILVVSGVIAGYLLHPAWFALSGFVGAGLVYAAITDSCGMALLITKAPWNR